MWNSAYLISLNHEYLKEVEPFQTFEYNKEKNTLTGYHANKERKHSYNLEWLPEDWSREISRSAPNAGVVYRLLGRPRVFTLEEWCFTYLLRRQIENNLASWVYSNDRITYRYRGETKQITVQPQYPLHRVEVLTAVEALIAGYHYQEVPGSHYEVGKENTIPVATTPWSCTCTEYTSRRRKENCLHLCLVKTLLDLRSTRLEVEPNKNPR